MADKKQLAACAVTVGLIMKIRRRKQRNRHIWVREWIQGREEKGAYHQLLQELRLTDINSYRNFLRMDSTTFDELLQMVGPLDTILRKAIPPSERLALTLRFIATGTYN